MGPVFSRHRPGAAAQMEPSQEKEAPGCPGVCWAGEARACLPAIGSRLPPPLPLPPHLHSSFSVPLPPLLFPISSPPSTFSLLQSLLGCSLGTGEGLWVRHRQTLPTSYFTSHVFILMGTREKPHKRLAHQGFISRTLLLRVRPIGK